MKLSMWIFVDWLKEYAPKPDIKSNLFAIETVRLFSANMNMNQNTMYIGRLSDFFKTGNDNVICIHNNDMILLETTDLEEILNSVLNAFEHYNSWNTTLLELLSSNAMLQDLFNASIAYIREPFFLLDAGLRVLAYTTEYGLGQVDSFWDEMLQTGSAGMDFLVSFNLEHSDRFHKKELYFYGDDVFPHHCYNQNFFFQNDWVGTAILVDLNNNLSQGTLDLFILFRKYLDRWFQLHIQEQHSVILDHLLQSAITDSDADISELQRQLILSGWKETDSFIFIKLDAPYQPFSINTYLCRTLNYHFQDLYAVNAELSICLLCNISRCPLDILSAQLLPWLERSKYYGVLGQPFTIQDSFYHHYRYTELTSEYCQKVPGQLYEGSQYVLPYIFYEMQNTIIPNILHPALKTLQNYDENNHTDFYLTLYHYLKNERSLIHTAKELRLHRNSLSYRLSRIQELLDADLEDFHTRLHILISYETQKQQLPE